MLFNDEEITEIYLDGELVWTMPSSGFVVFKADITPVYENGHCVGFTENSRTINEEYVVNVMAPLNNYISGANPGEQELTQCMYELTDKVKQEFVEIEIVCHATAGCTSGEVLLKYFDYSGSYMILSDVLSLYDTWLSLSLHSAELEPKEYMNSFVSCTDASSLDNIAWSSVAIEKIILHTKETGNIL